MIGLGPGVQGTRANDAGPEAELVPTKGKRSSGWSAKLRKNWRSHIDASHSRQPLVKGERLVRYEVNAVMPEDLARPQPTFLAYPCLPFDCPSLQGGWAKAPIKIARMTLTIKLDGNWSSFQLANSAPPLSVTDSCLLYTSPSPRD